MKYIDAVFPFLQANFMGSNLEGLHWMSLLGHAVPKLIVENYGTHCNHTVKITSRYDTVVNWLLDLIYVPRNKDEDDEEREDLR